MIYSLLAFIVPVALHFFFTFTTTFFISPEISLYPYFVSQGLTPYLQLIDQHFPALFFGPFNLSLLGVTTPFAALLTFIAVLFLTDLAAFLLIKDRFPRPKEQLLLFLGFIFLQLLLSTSTFWLESFILLFLLWGYYLFSRSQTFFPLLSGLMFSLVLSIRPTLLPFFLLFLYLHKERLKLAFLAASALFPLLQLLWLTFHHLWPPFLKILTFNSTYYPSLAAQSPSFNQLVILGLAFLLPLLLVKGLKNKSLVLAYSLLLACGAYPRFELIHLLPVAFVLFLLLPSKINHKLLLGWLLLVASLTLYRHPFISANFYYPPSLPSLAQELQTKIKGSQLYILGGPDQLYQLTRTVPTGRYYLPSLPWYFAQPDFVSAQLQALKENPATSVIVNTQSSVDNLSLTQYATPILEYIADHYQKTDSLGPLDIYHSSDAVN